MEKFSGYIAILRLPERFFRSHSRSWACKGERRSTDLSKSVIFALNALSTALPSKKRTPSMLRSSLATLLKSLKIEYWSTRSPLLQMISHLLAFRTRPVVGKESMIICTSSATVAILPSKLVSFTYLNLVREFVTSKVGCTASKYSKLLNGSPCCDLSFDLISVP